MIFTVLFPPIGREMPPPERPDPRHKGAALPQSADPNTQCFLPVPEWVRRSNPLHRNYTRWHGGETAPEPIQVENEYVSENAEPTVEVTTEEASANTQESNEGDMAEPVADTSSEPVDATLDVENLPPTDDVNYDDQIMLIDDTAEVPEEGTDIVVEEPVTEEVIEEEIPEQLDIYDNQISGAGLNELEVYVDTEGLNNKDKFRIVFSGPDSAEYASILNEELDKNSAGTYRFRSLNKEGFNVRVRTNDDIDVIYSSENGTPVIKLVSRELNAEKSLEDKTVYSDNGSPISAIHGNGFEEVTISFDTEKLAIFQSVS